MLAQADRRIGRAVKIYAAAMIIDAGPGQPLNSSHGRDLRSTAPGAIGDVVHAGRIIGEGNTDLPCYAAAPCVTAPPSPPTSSLLRAATAASASEPWATISRVVPHSMARARGQGDSSRPPWCLWR